MRETSFWLKGSYKHKGKNQKVCEHHGFIYVNKQVSGNIPKHLNLITCIFQLLEQFLAWFGPSPSSILLNKSCTQGGNSQGPGFIPSWQFGCGTLFWRLRKLNDMEIGYSMPGGISTREVMPYIRTLAI